MTFELIFSVVLAGLGLFGVAYQARELLLARASTGWPACEAVVIDARVRTRRGRHSRYEPLVTYRYTYQEREYTGCRLTFGYLTEARAEAERLVKQFSPGSHWEARVCNTRPKLSVLHPGTTRRLWYGVVFSSAFAMATLAFLANVLGRLR
jgi:hypothetical protein